MNKLLSTVIQAVQNLSPLRMLFLVSLSAILVVGGVAFLALRGGRRGDHA